MYAIIDSLLTTLLVCCVYCCSIFLFFFFKQKTAYEMRISDWSSDVCSSDLEGIGRMNDHNNPPSLIDDEPEESGAPAIGGETGQQIGRASCRERVCQYV